MIALNVAESQTAFVSRLQEARWARNWTVRELAERSGVKKRTMDAWIHGGNWPKDDNVRRVAKALGVDVRWLRGETHGRCPMCGREKEA